MPQGSTSLYVPAPRSCGKREFAGPEAVKQFLIEDSRFAVSPDDARALSTLFSATYLARDEAAEARAMRRRPSTASVPPATRSMIDV